MARKPLITAAEANPFGEVDPKLVDDVSTDPFELPGYSDKRREQDTLLRKNRAAPALPFRVHLTRVMKDTGVPDYRKLAERTRKGYKQVSPEELEQRLGKKLWDENGNPLSSYQKGPDNTVRLNEYAVMICDSSQAAANLEVVKQRQRDLDNQGYQRTALSSEGRDMHFVKEEAE